MHVILPIILAGALLLATAAANAQQAKPPFAVPKFHFLNNDASDYRPVLNAGGALAIFERTLNGVTKLYVGDLGTGTVRLFVDVAGAERADWCWRRAPGVSPTTGPVAFSTSSGVWRVNVGASAATLLPNTSGMLYPAWYPTCQYLAVDVGGANAQVNGQRNITAKIDALSGKVVAAPLANDQVWAGFASVNQVNPNIVAFAGQFRGDAAYYNQELNYVWVARPPVSGGQPVAPLDQQAPDGPGFLSQFQARAGWWSPDGKWFAFESNRRCNDVSGMTYAIFIQDADGANPAQQVSSCEWNAQHPKWFPMRAGKAMLIAAVARPPEKKFHIATFDVTAFVQGP